MLRDASIDHAVAHCLLLPVLAALGCNSILGNQPAARASEPPTDPNTATIADAQCPEAGTDCGAAPSASGPAAVSCSEFACGDAADCVMDGDRAGCVCKDGFRRQNGACTDIDECADANGGCDPHAACVNLPGHRDCDCQTGYRAVDGSDSACASLCDEAKCDPHASCTIVDDRALCTCLAPYIGNGLTCSYDAGCASHNCDQNARCLGGGPSPCVCSDGFDGDGITCTRVDPCQDAPCQHNGVCSAVDGSFSCDCENTGYRGARCELAIDDCAPNPCLHGVCTDLVSGYSCACAAGYGRPQCAIDIDDCESQPCKRGSCVDLVNDYKCMCPAGWSGKDCNNDIDNCAGKPCVHGMCVDQVDGYSCDCEAGYDGVNCENNIDDCAAKPCVHGTCSDQVNGYSCSCTAGYDGAQCDHDIDNCAAKPCVHGTCTDKVNAYSCACQKGWAGAKCDTGSCANVTCPSSAPCRVPSKNAGMCYPSDCGSMVGLCLATNADASGDASTELLTEENDTFNFGTGNNWNNRSRYFAYINAVGSYAYVCVFPNTNLGGTPVVIPLGQSRTTSAAFGQSNAFPNSSKCPKP